jgi:shikimate kinase
VIFLDISISAQIDRVKNRKNRPLLNYKNLKDNLLSLKKIRDPIYKKISNYIIDVTGKQKNQIIDEIQKLI